MPGWILESPLWVPTPLCAYFNSSWEEWLPITIIFPLQAGWGCITCLFSSQLCIQKTTVEGLATPTGCCQGVHLHLDPVRMMATRLSWCGDKKTPVRVLEAGEHAACGRHIDYDSQGAPSNRSIFKDALQQFLLSLYREDSFPSRGRIYFLSLGTWVYPVTSFTNRMEQHAEPLTLDMAVLAATFWNTHCWYAASCSPANMWRLHVKKISSITCRSHMEKNQVSQATASAYFPAMAKNTSPPRESEHQPHSHSSAQAAIKWRRTN